MDRASLRGLPSTLAAAWRSVLATAWAASRTAAPDEAAVQEPPSTGAVVRSLSPTLAVTCSGATVGVSAATSVSAA